MYMSLDFLEDFFSNQRFQENTISFGRKMCKTHKKRGNLLPRLKREMKLGQKFDVSLRLLYFQTQNRSMPMRHGKFTVFEGLV